MDDHPGAPTRLDKPLDRRSGFLAPADIARQRDVG
jgi:hypothetical protein